LLTQAANSAKAFSEALFLALFSAAVNVVPFPFPCRFSQALYAGRFELEGLTAGFFRPTIAAYETLKFFGRGLEALVSKITC